MNNEDEAQFENPDVDPGFEGHQNDEALEGREDERDENIDSNISIKEMREGKSEADEKPEEDEGAGTSGENSNNDALNYKNDRDHGAFNPKNI